MKDTVLREKVRVLLDAIATQSGEVEAEESESFAVEAIARFVEREVIDGKLAQVNELRAKFEESFARAWGGE